MYNPPASPCPVLRVGCDIPVDSVPLGRLSPLVKYTQHRFHLLILQIRVAKGDDGAHARESARGMSDLLAWSRPSRPPVSTPTVGDAKGLSHTCGVKVAESVEVELLVERRREFDDVPDSGGHVLPPT